MNQSMELERWLRKNNMETNELARLSGCTRQVIWKVKKNETIDEETANNAALVTATLQMEMGCLLPFQVIEKQIMLANSGVNGICLTRQVTKRL